VRGEAGEAGKAAETHSEAGAQDPGVAGEQGGETILGINPAATPVVVAVVIGWVVLAAALLLLGPRAPILRFTLTPSLFVVVSGHTRGTARTADRPTRC
jgi:hypothetical protein